MYTKSKIYNLTLQALLLAKEISEPETDPSNEARILNIHWDSALWSTLQDLDLDSTSSDITLELTVELTEGPWNLVYKYPDNCAFMRRILSGAVVDNRFTHISKVTKLYGNQKSVFTNKIQAVAACIPKDLPLSNLNVMAGMAVAYRLAFLSAPLIVGKGSSKLRDSLQASYLIAKLEAQEADSLENFNYEAESTRSEFVAERMS